MRFQVVTTGRGDVREPLDERGNSFAFYSYDAYGNPAQTLCSVGMNSAIDAATVTAISRQPLRYAGYAYDGHSGLYYLSQRYYDPATMQFISKDSARADGEESAYQYCAGEPVGSVDPSGLTVGAIFPQSDSYSCAVIYNTDNVFYFWDGDRKFRIEVDVEWVFGRTTTGYLRGVSVKTIVGVHMERIKGTQGRRIEVRIQKYVWRESTEEYETVTMGTLAAHTENSTSYDSTYSYDWLYGIKVLARPQALGKRWKYRGWVKYPSDHYRHRGDPPSIWPE
ncbi:MAG: RHS repeat-associated core domain-containing protein [Coriobacteriia bacterium]|nr:RHS repeat-associated core domain-containing protein [Coriobacteriia bacterium]